MPDTPTFVVGDFNDVIEGDVFTTLLEAGVANVFAEMPVTLTSWEWAGAEPPLAALLDHVAYDRAHFTPIEAKVVPGGRSDHRAVVARFAY
jgi:endonuclease/exonuclease/phosphatase (EEP) superfamily protein YafD